jgi:uncharacterized FAD-dependent dehydrogenase
VGATAPISVDLVVHPDLMLDEGALVEVAAKKVGLALSDVSSFRLRRRAIDARRGRVRLDIGVDLFVLGSSPDEERPRPRELPSLAGEPRVVIVGSGPAGLFCALELARRGIRAIVLERGKTVRARRRDIAALQRTGKLDPESNYAYGEGGAGTFSDGKLYTRARKRGPLGEILEAFVAYGAPFEILVDARPHVGTTRLPRVITGMREHLESAGVVFRFESRVDGLVLRGPRVCGVILADGTRIDAEAVVLAPGHSARDVQRWLDQAGVRLAFKPFAMGIRIEHPQALIDRMQFGSLAGHPALGAATYRLVERVGERGVFSFCMCPGGHIAPTSTESDCQVVNGWSPTGRRGRFANSGFVVEIDAGTLTEAGLDRDDALAGVRLQRKLESEAFSAGGGGFVAPAQRLVDFVNAEHSSDLPASSYVRGLRSAPLSELLGPLHVPLKAALVRAGERMPGWLGEDAIAVGVESRTSCPVRIEREQDALVAVGRPGLFPCGEGAGYSGGIVSSAADGIRVAEAVERALQSPGRC